MTNQTKHHAEAILRDIRPAAFIVRHPKHFKELAEQKLMQADKDADWTETPLYPASAILDAVQAERAAIVAWLRRERHNIENWQMLYDVAAGRIERGEHLPQDTPQ